MKIAVVYWSGTGNTETMAEALASGAKESGAEVVTSTSDDFSSVDGFDAVAFGCPAMGSESLEDSSFEPMFESVEDSLSEKKVALFGSYGWGDGEWMREWEERVKDKCGVFVGSSICNEAPDDSAKEELVSLGKKLAE